MNHSARDERKETLERLAVLEGQMSILLKPDNFRTIRVVQKGDRYFDFDDFQTGTMTQIQKKELESLKEKIAVVIMGVIYPSREARSAK